MLAFAELWVHVAAAHERAIAMQSTQHRVV